MLFLGSFPPPKTRWCMDFYYPNWINDMWRILGLIFEGDKDALILKDEKRFDYEKVVKFCKEHKIAIYDAAHKVRREKGNASDKFLTIIESTDLVALLSKIPDCKAVVSTGGKSAETIAEMLDCKVPATGSYTDFTLESISRPMRFYRMPSSSRAYPMSIEKKAIAYSRMFTDLNLIQK